MDSPCIKVCVIDPATRLCEGCGRTLSEIAGWSSFSDAERRRIMADLGHRRSRGAALARGSGGKP